MSSLAASIAFAGGVAGLRPGSRIRGNAFKPGIEASIGVDARQVMATLGYLPAALIGVIVEENWDLINHHRSSVLKHHRFPARRASQNLIAASTQGYGRRRPNPRSLSDAQGEIFMGDVPAPDKFGVGFWRTMEFGRAISARRPMAVSFAAINAVGAARTRIQQQFRDALTARRFAVTRGGLLVLRKGRLSGQRRGEIIGKLIRRRTQGRLLGFYEQFDRIVPAHLSRYDEFMDLALTESGRESLALYPGWVHSYTKRVFEAQMKKFLDKNPGKDEDARRVANKAAKVARRRALKTLLSSKGRAKINSES